MDWLFWVYQLPIPEPYWPCMTNQPTFSMAPPTWYISCDIWRDSWNQNLTPFKVHISEWYFTYSIHEIRHTSMRVYIEPLCEMSNVWQELFSQADTNKLCLYERNWINIWLFAWKRSINLKHFVLNSKQHDGSWKSIGVSMSQIKFRFDYFCLMEVQ